MKKLELVLAIANETGLTKADAERALNAFIKVVTEEVKKGNKVAVSGLGSFERVARAARKGINPATGASINIKAKNAPKFKAAKGFKDLVA
ncbi:HU family DNA-binding protein [Candidatus Mycoplasma mahonii]|uniref:HU family DNA-binding protein n=1 Tax=Candidatus Mycoplasma mahonii TaxID=3004105 RepID=UPI0026EB350C|nr:HU family DNA-binding protein [Candidatus Mycoplasma mahonii]WKX02620.1 HU family DNA-binding protein [Candidatus Mycoplasma mahonii]